MNEAQRKVRTCAAFTVVVLCLLLLLAGDLFSRSLVAVVLALGFYLLLGGKREE